MEDFDLFIGATDTSVLDFQRYLPWISEPFTCVLCHLHAMDSADSPRSMTPADFDKKIYSVEKT